MLLTLLYIVGFLKTLVFLLVIFLIIRFFRKLMEPVKSTTQNQRTTKSQSKKEGETTIKFNKKGKKVVDKEEGEYVDFEEVN